MNVCDCNLCQRTRKFRETLDRVPEADKKFWNDIYDTLFHAEFDLNYYRAIVEGSWPSADEILARYRAKPSGGS